MTRTSISEFELTPELSGHLAYLHFAQEANTIDDIHTPQAVVDTATAVPQSQTRESQLSTSMPRSVSDNWYSLLTSGLSDGAQTRLRRLAQLDDGWHGRGSKALQSASLKNFLLFWRIISENAIEPFLTLTPNGHLYTEWHRNWRRHLDLEFTEDHTVYFGLLDRHYVNEGLDRRSEVARIFLSRTSNPFRWE